MTEGVNSSGALEDAVVRILEHQSKYGIDHDAMLIYLSSVNLMSILQLLNRRYGSNAVITPSLPLPPLVSETSPGGGPSPDNMLGTLLKMLGGQNSGDSAGQGVNPAAMLNLLSALSRNVDLGKMMGMLSGLMGPAGKTASSQQQNTSGASNGSEPAHAGPRENDKKSGEDRGEKREVPRIMKWDQLDSGKR